MLPLLTLGTGINSGVSTAGMMGSMENIISYTVFGPVVNLASRLEGLSGRGRIIVGQRTYEQIKAIDPEFASTFVPQPPAKLKGFSEEQKTYEVPWKLQDPAASAPAAKPQPASVVAG